jgi:hypothetical protein
VSRLRRILDLARWAPSGDNSQPWRFEIVSPTHVVVHAFTNRLGVYDLDGSAARISVGAMLETMRIAASVESCTLRIAPRGDAGEDGTRIDVRLEEADVAVDPLHRVIRERSVQRKPLSTRPLGQEDKSALEGALGGQFRVRWFETSRERLQLAWLAVRSAKIRLTIPEAYDVHRRIIEWDARYSEDRIPDQALGTDPLSVRSMRWVLASWPRVQRMNRYFAGTLAPRLQLEFLPGLRCAAHFAVLAQRAPHTTSDHLRAGAAVQRFWLTATALGLQLQPQHTPLMFAGYARQGIRFTEVRQAQARAVAVGAMLDELLGPGEAPNAVFLGRVGSGAAAKARSLRLPLEQLILSDAGASDTSAAARAEGGTCGRQSN